MKQEITEEIKAEIKKLFWKNQDNGKIMLSLRNCRLDFKKDYYFDKFTKKGIKLYWLNGTDKVPVTGCVEKNETYGDYSFYTEGWSYIERFKLVDEDE